MLQSQMGRRGKGQQRTLTIYEAWRLSPVIVRERDLTARNEQAENLPLPCTSIFVRVQLTSMRLIASKSMRACEEVGELPHWVGLASLGWRRWGLVGVWHGPAGGSARFNPRFSQPVHGARGWPGMLGIDWVHTLETAKKSEYQIKYVKI